MKNHMSKLSLKLVLISVLIVFVAINVFLLWNVLKEPSTKVVDETVDFQSKKNILVLYSYSPAFDTYPMLIQGLKTELDNYNIQIDVESMDTKRLNDENNLNNFYNSLKYKLDKLDEYDVIIASDDNALKFALKYRNELFKDKPLLFCGINNLELALMASEETDVMGIAESISIKGTLDIATKLYPAADTINFITDGTASGKVNLEIYKDTEKQFPNYEHRILNLSELSYDELSEELSYLNNDDIALLAASYLDKNGVSKTTQASSNAILKNCSVPVFALFDFQLENDGFIGGQVASHYDMGAYIGNLTVKILLGEPLENYNNLEYSDNKYLFNYLSLNEYGLNNDDLPEESILINKPLSFFDQFREYIFGGIFIIAFQLLVIGVMAINIKYRKKLEENLIKENFADELTNLYNRRKLQYDFNNNFLTNKSFIFIDVDSFKMINDIYGHLFGDYVLIQLANRMLKLPNSTAYRIAGDEFVIVIDNISIFEKLDKYIEDISKPIVNKQLGNVYSISVSVGALEKVDNEATLDEIIALSDIALYEAKRGYEKIIYVNYELKRQYNEIAKLQKYLINSAYNNELIPYYQPIVSLKDGKVAGFEVLARWEYEGQVLPAFKFIHNAIVLKVISNIDQTMLIKTNEFLSSHFNKSKNHFFCFNISESSLFSLLKDDYKWQKIFESLKKSKVNSVFEISENVKLTCDIKSVLDDISNKYDFKFAIDDYGSGESNLNYLNNDAFELIKTDISIMPNSKEDNVKYELFCSFIDFIHRLGKQVVVEGVETKEQLDIAVECGVEYVQGYYLSYPLNYNEVLTIKDKIFDI